MVVRVIGFSSGGYKNQKDVCLRISILKENYWILRIVVISGELLKIGHHFSKKENDLEIGIIKKCQYISNNVMKKDE